MKCRIAIRLPKCEDISTGSHSERFSNFYADSAKGLNSDFDPHFSQDSRLQCEECKMEKQERILGDQTKTQEGRRSQKAKSKLNFKLNLPTKNVSQTFQKAFSVSSNYFKYVFFISRRSLD